MIVSEKQKYAIEIAHDPSIIELLVGGSGGGSKTFTMGMIAALLCKEYAGMKNFIFRKTGVSLRRTTLSTLLSEVHPALGITDSDFEFKGQLGEIWYKNGSKIILMDLDYSPSDPDYSKLGSLGIDFAFIDEAGEIVVSAKNAVKSRVGRGPICQKLKIPGKLILSCNPSQNFLRQEYYDPYEQAGAGEFQKWQIGDYISQTGEKLPSYRAFLRMSVFDNPFISKNYIETLKTLPDRERKRLLDGNWDYYSEDDSLFPPDILMKAMTYDIPESEEKFNKFIGVDVADGGKDETVVTLIENGVVTDQRSLKIDKSNPDAPLSRLYADELSRFAENHGFTRRESRNIAIESNGVGVGMRDMMRAKGWQITDYKATGKSRSENYYNLYLDFDSCSVRILKSLSSLDELRRELSAHTYDMDNQDPKVVPKDKLKLKIGRSPDFADSLMIASFCRREMMFKRRSRITIL